MSSSLHTIRILVINPNNWYNKGDVSNRLGLIKALKKTFGDDVNITIESLTPENDREYFSKFNVKVIESIFSCNKSLWPSYVVYYEKIKNMLLFLIFLLFYKIFKYEIRINHKSSLYLKYLINSDLVISSPGGFLQDYQIFSSLIPNMFLLIGALILNKPVIIYAQSIGVFNNRILRFIMKLILNRVNIILLREDISRNYLIKVGVDPSRILLTADATFSIDQPSYNRDEYRRNLLMKLNREAGNVLIGITIIGDYFLSYKKHKILKKYILSLIKFINHITNKIDATIIFIPQVWLPSERSVINLIEKFIINKSRVISIDEDLPPDEIIKYIGSLDLLVGTRMHSNIFAMITGIPVVAIAYEHKTYGIMKMLGLENFVININDIDASLIVNKVDEILENYYCIKKYISKKVEIAKRRSLLNAVIVRTLYERNIKRFPFI